MQTDATLLATNRDQYCWIVICCVRLPTLLHVELLHKLLATCKRTQQLRKLLGQKILGVVASVWAWLKEKSGMKAPSNDVSTELALKSNILATYIVPVTGIYLLAAVEY